MLAGGHCKEASSPNWQQQRMSLSKKQMKTPVNFLNITYYRRDGFMRGEEGSQISGISSLYLHLHSKSWVWVETLLLMRLVLLCLTSRRSGRACFRIIRFAIPFRCCIRLVTVIIEELLTSLNRLLGKYGNMMIACHRYYLHIASC